MIRRAAMFAMLIIAVAMIGAGCGSDKGTNGTPENPYDNIHLDLFTVPALGSAMMYELWAKPVPALAAADGDWVSLGKFNVVVDGLTRSIVDADGDPIDGNDLLNLPVDLEEFDSLFVTIEPNPDSDELPSASVYLSGNIDFSRFTIVDLEFDQSLKNLSSGSFFTFESITDNDLDTINALSGVWFMLGGGIQQPGLKDLAPAPDGWLYQGWVEHDGFVLSTGRFSERTGDDLDAPYSSNAAAPPGFPGEDFLLNSPNAGLPFPLTFEDGDRVWVTVEPFPDPDPGSPFPYTIYEWAQERPPTWQQNFSLIENNDDFPDAAALMSRDSTE